MNGAIFSARFSDIEYIKFTGTVRYSHCVGLESHIEQIFHDKDFNEIVIDLEDAEILDSTALGLLARIAIKLKNYTEQKSVIFVHPGELANILERVCFDKVFNIVTDKSYDQQGQLKELVNQPQSEQQVLSRVIEAHKNLVHLSQNSDKFYRDITHILS